MGSFKEWTRRTQDPRVQLEFEQRDLAGPRLPPAGLILGVHPGPNLAPDLVIPGHVKSQGNPWRQILENVLGSRAVGGRCIFASFYEHEVEGIRTVRQANGAQVKVCENSYYQTDPMPNFV